MLVYSECRNTFHNVVCQYTRIKFAFVLRSWNFAKLGFTISKNLTLLTNLNDDFLLRVTNWDVYLLPNNSLKYFRRKNFLAKFINLILRRHKLYTADNQRYLRCCKLYVYYLDIKYHKLWAVWLLLVRQVYSVDTKILTTCTSGLMLDYKKRVVLKLLSALNIDFAWVLVCMLWYVLTISIAANGESLYDTI